MFKKYIDIFLSLEKKFYQKSVDSYFERDIEKDLDYFRKLHPNDNFGRSIAQHRCQVFPFKKDVSVMNFLSLFLTPIVMVILLFKARVLIKDDKSTIVCYRCFNLPGTLPEALHNKDIHYLISSKCPYYLSKTDVLFLFRFFLRNICRPFLAFRVLLKVSKYRAIIDSFNELEAITITGEFVDTSSAMTQYCHENGIKHYNFMQGEAFGSPRASFFKFDKCFVWDHHYMDVFITFGASPEQFVVSIPNFLQKKESSSIKKSIDYTYYLGGETESELRIIRIAIDKLVEEGFVCEVRPHPRWSNMEIVKIIFDGVAIQDTSLVSIDNSILKTKNAVSLYSTVLIQAFFNGVHVVIDDLSCPDKYKKLESYRYIMLNKPHKLLSEIVTNKK